MRRLKQSAWEDEQKADELADLLRACEGNNSFKDARICRLEKELKDQKEQWEREYSENSNLISDKNKYETENKQMKTALGTLRKHCEEMCWSLEQKNIALQDKNAENQRLQNDLEEFYSVVQSQRLQMREIKAQLEEVVVNQEAPPTSPTGDSSNSLRRRPLPLSIAYTLGMGDGIEVEDMEGKESIPMGKTHIKSRRWWSLLLNVGLILACSLSLFSICLSVMSDRGPPGCDRSCVTGVTSCDSSNSILEYLLEYFQPDLDHDVMVPY